MNKSSYPVSVLTEGRLSKIALILITLVALLTSRLQAQGWQKSYLITSGYTIESLGPPVSGTIAANLKNGLSNAYFTVNAADGNLISLNPAVPDCDPAPFGGDLRYSATEYFDHSLTATNDLRIRRVKLVPNTCTIDQIIFDQEYDLPVVEAVYLVNMVFEAQSNFIFISGMLQLNPTGSSTHYQIFVKKINASTGTQVWEYQTPTMTIAGPPSGQSWQLLIASQSGGVYATKSGVTTGGSLMLIKLEGNGQLVYNKPIGGSYSFIRGATEEADGSILVRMQSASLSGPGDNYRAIRWDANGNEIFSLHAGLTLDNYFGGSAWAFLASFDAHARLSNGDFLLAGKNTGGLNGAIPGIHVNRVSPSGAVLWTRFYPDVLVDFTHALETFPDNGFLLGGNSNGEMFLMKTNSLGLTDAGPGTVDLKLTSAASQPNPPLWSNVTLTYTLQNTGTAVANDITVRMGTCETFNFGQNSGLVYANTNFQASAGTYLQVSQAWIVPTLGPGEVATLSITLFTLTNEVRRVFGEISDGPADVDSTPGNWLDCTPDEDDETVVILNPNNGCEIILDLLGTVCNDNGTPNNPNDDYYYANINVSKSGSACFNEFTYNAAGGVGGNGFFNSDVSVGPLPANEFASSISFTSDTGTTATVAGLNVLSPGHCSGNGTACFITALAVNPLCHDSNTPNDPNDDTFTYQLLVQKSGNCSSQWTNGVNVFSYGTPVTYATALIADGPFTVTVWDVTNPASTATAQVNPVPPCSSGGNILPDFSSFSWGNFVTNVANPGSNFFAPGGGICFPQSQINGTAAPSFVPPGPLAVDIYLSADGVLGASDVLFFNTTQPYNNLAGTGQLFGEGGNGCTTLPANIPNGTYKILAKLDPNNALQEANENNNVFEMATITIQSSGNGQIDLSLALQQTLNSPAQWSNYSVKATLSNAGPQAATGVKVKFAKPNGVVYVGGNEFTTSQGSFTPFGNEEWNVGSIPANGSATLTVNYFLLNATAPVAYAQVTAANETDSDSQPNNGTLPMPNQDDEAATGGGGPPNLTPDLTISDFQIPNPSVQAGQVLSYHFDAANIGTGAVPGIFTIKSYISSNPTLSANDIQDGTIQTGNYMVGFSAQDVPGASTIPANLTAGQYYLLVKIDADGVVAESDENNNVVVKPFTVTGGATICQGDLILESQAEVDAVPDCSIIDGGLYLRSPNGTLGASSDITDLSPLLGITKVNGPIIIDNNDLLFNLHGLENITSAHHIAILYCENIQNVAALSGLSGIMELGIVILHNPSLLNLNGLEGITRLKHTLTLTDNTSLQNLDGLSGLTSVDIFGVDLGGNPSLTSIQGLNSLTSVGGLFFIGNCDALQNLNGLENLQSTGALGIVSNNVLQDVSALGSLTTIQDNLFVSGNFQLSDCCIFHDLLANNSVNSVTFENNAGNCNSVQDILDNCAGTGDPCNAITITPAPGQITIAGASAPHVLIKVFKPNWQTAFDCLDNCPGPVVVGGLANGIHYVEIKLLDAGWAEICRIGEYVNISSYGGNGGTALKFRDDRQRLAIDRIYPNPAKYLVTLDLYSKLDQQAVMDIYNQQGQAVHRLSMELKQGENEVQIPVFDWKSGTYNLILRGEGMPAYGRFLKVWEE